MQQIVPVLITYSQGNLNSIGRDPNDVLTSISGLQTCHFNYSEPLKSHKKVQITFEGNEWGVIVELGKDKLHFANPWFRKKKLLSREIEDNTITKDCYIILKSDHCDTLRTIISCKYSSSIAETMELVSACDRLTKPVIPVHKEEEKEIWTAYCDGLNALNKERTEFISLKYIGKPLLFNDSRQGEIYTLKLGIDTKSVKEIPDAINKLLNSKYQVSGVDINDEETVLSIHFTGTETIAEDDMEELCEYLASFGFTPSPGGVENTLRASLTLSGVSDFQEELKTLTASLKESGIQNSGKSQLSFNIDNDSQLKVLKDAVRAVFKGSVRVEVNRKITVYHFAPSEVILSLKNRLDSIEKIEYTDRKLTLLPENASEYKSLSDEVQNIFSTYGIALSFPKYHLLAELEAKRDIEYRQERMSFADSYATPLKELASSYEYDPEKAFVIRMEFKFQTASQREELIAKIKDAFSELGPEYKLILKNPHGSSHIEFNRTPQAVEQLEEELKTNYLGEEIKLINGKAYRELFSSITDPTNIINPELREKYARFMIECPIIGTCHKRTIDSIIVNLSEDFYNGERYSSRIFADDMIFFPSVGVSTELKRQTEAIQRINKPGEKMRNGRVVSPPVNPKLSDFLFSPLYARDISDDINSEMKRIRANSLEKQLNDKQIEAVAKAILAKDIAFIQGPPGTGKTTVIAEIIWQIIQKNPNSTILLTSQTNLAVDNALERLKQKKAIRPLRVISELRNDNDDIIYNSNLLDTWVESPNETNKGNVVENWIDRIAERLENNKRFSGIIDEWRKSLIEKDYSIRKQFVDLYKSNVNLIAATCSICGSQLFHQLYSKMYNLDEVAFDVVIMDEASKATPLEMAVPMVLGKKIVLIGDHKQLPPLMDDSSIDTALTKIGRQDLACRIQDLKESQFKKLFLMAQKYKPKLITSLDTQYRMHKDIMMTINQFYVDDLGHDGLKCGIENVMDVPDYSVKGSRWHGITNEPFLSPSTHAIWVNVTGKEEKEYTSYRNMDEVHAVQTVIKALTLSDGFSQFIDAQNQFEDKEIGIITFYSAQKRALKRIEQEGGLSPFYDYRIEVVDKFQGMERNIVVVSTVRSNKYNSIGFAKEIERINVAFSRARSLLIVVGDKDLFSSKDNYVESISAMETIEIKQLEDLVRNEGNNE